MNLVERLDVELNTVTGTGSIPFDVSPCDDRSAGGYFPGKAFAAKAAPESRGVLPTQVADRLAADLDADCVFVVPVVGFWRKTGRNFDIRTSVPVIPGEFLQGRLVMRFPDDRKVEIAKARPFGGRGTAAYCVRTGTAPLLVSAHDLKKEIADDQYQKHNPEFHGALLPWQRGRKL